jgi:hypothetical protein
VQTYAHGVATGTFGVRPQVVAVSSGSGFPHLVQTLLDTVGLPVRTTADWQAAHELVERLRPKLVVLDRVPGHEAECWLAVEALKARASTRTIPLQLCPVADWLLAGHEARLKQHLVHLWPEGFDLNDLRGTVQLALTDQRVQAGPLARADVVAG